MQSRLKFTGLVLFCTLFLSFSVWAAPVPDNTLRISQPDGTFTDTDLLPITFSQDETGTAIFSVAPTHWQDSAGEPGIPWQTITVLLPPHTDISTVLCSAVSAEYETIEGTWDVAPVPPLLTLDRNGNEITIWPKNKTIVDGCDVDIYSVDALWPAEDTKLVGTGKLHGWNLAEIAVPLVIYNPVSGRLQQLIRAEVMVDYDQKGKGIERGLKHNRGRKRAEKLAANFNQAVVDYDISASSPTSESLNIPADAPADDNGALTLSPGGTSGYVIITTNDIRANSTKLSDFVMHKENMGFTVTVIDEDDTGATVTGDAAATKLREWLQANYIAMDLKYALIIGDPQPNNDYVPMKLYPCGGRDIPTDYFYAELTCDWDSNENGIIGESGEIERYFEVYVGRIPYYGVIADTDAILQKTMDYENATNAYWRRNTLISVVPLDSTNHCYGWGEQVKADSLEPKAMPSDRVYRDGYGHTVTNYNIIPPPEYPASAYPATVWSQGQYGLHIWSTHGWSGGASGICSSGDAANLNDNYPSTVWQGSCENAYPYSSSNLSYSLLKNGGIVTNGATRNSYYYTQTDFSNSPTDCGMGYRYAKGISEGKSCGAALWDLKEEISSWWTHNWTLFNPYGDPSVVVMPETPPFTVSPTDAFYVSRIKGNPTVTTSRSYTLSNNTGVALNWTTTKTAAWLDAPTGGTVPANDSTVINITMNSTSDSLSFGTHTDTVIFTDTTNGIVEQRDVVLTLTPQMMLGYWKLDETTGTSASDSSGNGKTATLAGGTPAFSFDLDSVTGQFGGALEFGSGQYIDIGASDISSFPWTACMWAKRTGTGSSATLLDSGTSSLRLEQWNGTGKVGVTVYGVADYAFNYTAPLDTWVHLTFIGTSSDVSLWVEGFYQDSLSVSIPCPMRTFSNDSDELAAVIDDVRIYNYALDTTAIAALVQGGRAENPSPYDGAVNVSFPILSWSGNATSVEYDIYVGTSYDAVVNATTSSPVYQGRQTKDEYQLPVLYMDADYYWRIDCVDGSETVTPGAVWSFSTGNGTGSVIRQVWLGIAGSSVSDLTGDPDYPDHPDITDELNTFEAPTDWADDYGTRIHGYLLPQTSGSYTFWIASDDYSELWLSSDHDPANASKIAEVPGWTDPRQWNEYSQQESNPVTLVAGQIYYIRALQKEGGGGDNLAVAWQGPGITQQVIDGTYLSAALLAQAPQLMVNHWPLDETSGPTADDVAGDNDGTLTNGPAWQPAGGQIDGDLAFDGSDDYVDLGTYSALSGATEFTISCWVNPAQLPFSNHAGIMGIGTSGQRAPWFWGKSGTDSLTVQFETMAGGAADGDLQMGAMLANDWTHVAVSWDGSTCTSYINGVFDNSVGTTGNKLAFSDGINYLGHIDGYGYWNGLLDDIRVYNYTLTEKEISTLYQQGRPGDLDLDGDVDLVDLNLLGGQYLLYNGHTESAGLVVIEAEHFTDNTPGSGALTDSDWTQLTGSGSLGDGFMQALPDEAKSINTNIELYSPQLSYQINFGTTGDYYLWLKGMADGGGADSVHYGLDGVCFSFDSDNALKVPQGGSFTWLSQKGSGTRPVVTIDSAGLHNFDLWMREDGAALDRLVLTTDASYNPTVSGEPTESTYQPALIADLDGNSDVDLADYALLANFWLEGVE